MLCRPPHVPSAALAYWLSHWLLSHIVLAKRSSYVQDRQCCGQAITKQLITLLCNSLTLIFLMPIWVFKSDYFVICYIKITKQKVTRKLATQHAEENRMTVVISYASLHGLSEAVTRAYRRRGISSAMKPFQTIKSLLVHPKDKRRHQDACECVYKIPCQNCDKTYLGETGRAFGAWLQEHRQEVTQRDVRAYTRSTRKSTEQNKSAVTDHAISLNHVTDWDLSLIHIWRCRRRG